MADIQTIVLRNLLTNEDYMRQVVPFLEPDYFEGDCKSIFKQIVKHVAKYNKLPTREAFSNDLLDESYHVHDDVSDLLEDIFTPKEENLKWLIDRTEKWCQDRALYLAIMKSMDIIDGRDKNLSKNALPDLLQRALAVSFDTNIGHDYFENVEERYAFYHEDMPRIPFDVDILNEATRGGFADKTLNVFMAGPGVGKSLLMCHHAANCLSIGKNVLYITLEMAEEKIAERIDANLLNIPIEQLEDVPRDMFISKVDKIAQKTNGKLIIKEYPTGHAHANHFRALLNELKLKKDFIPDIIFIDYINICASSRIKSMGGSINSYNYVKSISEEIRGLAVEQCVPIVSATQINRTGYTSSDPGMEDTSESFGLPATVDFMCVMLTNDELEELGQYMVIQLKNRYRDKSDLKRFCIGVETKYMRIFDVPQSSIKTVGDGEEDVAVFDQSSSGERVSQEKYGGIVV